MSLRSEIIAILCNESTFPSESGPYTTEDIYRKLIPELPTDITKSKSMESIKHSIQEALQSIDGREYIDSLTGVHIDHTPIRRVETGKGVDSKGRSCKTYKFFECY